MTDSTPSNRRVCVEKCEFLSRALRRTPRPPCALGGMIGPAEVISRRPPAIDARRVEIRSYSNVRCRRRYAGSIVAYRRQWPHPGRTILTTGAFRLSDHIVIVDDDRLL